DLLLRGGPCRAGARPHVAARRHERRALLRAHGAAPGAHARRGAAPGFRRTAASTVVGASRHTTTPPGAALAARATPPRGRPPARDAARRMDADHAGALLLAPPGAVRLGAQRHAHPCAGTPHPA